MTESISEQVVLQRIRNRIIEVLELFADDEAYQMAISSLEFWADWVDQDNEAAFTSPAFDSDEIAEISKVSTAWETVETSSLQKSKEWILLSQASKNALKVFMLRGKLSESVANA